MRLARGGAQAFTGAMTLSDHLGSVSWNGVIDEFAGARTALHRAGTSKASMLGFETSCSREIFYTLREPKIVIASCAERIKAAARVCPHCQRELATPIEVLPPANTRTREKVYYGPA